MNIESITKGAAIQQTSSVETITDSLLETTSGQEITSSYGDTELNASELIMDSIHSIAFTNTLLNASDASEATQVALGIIEEVDEYKKD